MLWSRRTGSRSVKRSSTCTSRSSRVADGSARATIELEFNLVRLEDHELLLLKSYREEEDVAGSEIGDSVDAFGRALHRILERLAADLPEA